MQKNFKKLQIFLKIGDIKILKTIPLHQESMQKPIKKTLEEVMWLLRLEKPKN